MTPEPVKRDRLPLFVLAGLLIVGSLAIVGAVAVFSGDSTPGGATTVAIPGPERTVTVVQQVNPPLSPPAPGRFGVAPGAVVGTVTTKGPWAGYTVWFVKWTSVKGAVAYKLWIDSKLTGTQAATPGDTQGVTFAVRCGTKHTFNLQVMNAAGEVGAKRPSAATFTVKPC